MERRSPAVSSSSGGRVPQLLLLAIPVAISGIVSLARPHPPLFDLGNLVGPTTESLLRGDGLTVCTEAMGTPGDPICFHAGRMPMASLVVALGIKLFGYRSASVGLFKTLLFLLPVEGAIFLAWTKALRSSWASWVAFALLLLPFGMPAFLADVVNLQVEEGYSYSLLAAAFASLIFSVERGKLGWIRSVCFALAADGVYLAKSSMAPAVAVLTLSYVLLDKHPWRRWIVAALVLAAPAGWAMHQHQASGRFSAGTSIDGINLHKGNNAAFLMLYPPPAGGTLDEHDRDLNAGLHFNDEWSFNDFHQRAALAFMRTYPRVTFEGNLRKLWTIFVSVTKSGSSEDRGGMYALEAAGLLIFRLMLWSGIVGACVMMMRPSRTGDRAAGAIFLGLVGAVALPYVLGFAYTRHVSVLIYPSALMCCRLLVQRERRRGAGSA